MALCTCLTLDVLSSCRHRHSRSLSRARMTALTLPSQIGYVHMRDVMHALWKIGIFYLWPLYWHVLKCKFGKILHVKFSNALYALITKLKMECIIRCTIENGTSFVHTMVCFRHQVAAECNGDTTCTYEVQPDDVSRTSCRGFDETYLRLEYNCLARKKQTDVAYVSPAK